jgi:uncharacterized membrane protein
MIQWLWMATQLQSKFHAKIDKLVPAGKGLVYLAVGVVLAGWLLNTPAGILGKADAIGYAVCHRIEERSFHVEGRPLSLCARCTGMYLGAVVGMVYQTLLGRRRTAWPRTGIMLVLGAFLVAFGVDGINSGIIFYMGKPLLYQPSNILRLITGTGMGLAMSIVLLPAFNQTVWRQYSPRSAIETWGQFAGLLGISGVVILLVLTESPVILYPASLVSAGGVMAILTMVYTMTLLMLFKKENHIAKLRQLIFPLAGGFLAALIQIVVIDVGRFILTGTWDGFHLFLG